MARRPARCSTGWWVGPSSPRPMEVVGHHVDHPDAHQGPQPDRRAANSRRRPGRCRRRGSPRRAAPCRSWPPPCRARARRSGRSGRRSRARRTQLMPLTRVLLEPVRSAEPPIISGTAGTRASSAAPECARVAAAGRSRPARRCGRCERLEGVGRAARPPCARSKSSRWSRALEPLLPSLARVGRRGGRPCAQAVGDVVGHARTARQGPAQALRAWRRSPRRPAPCRGCRGVALVGRGALADHGLAGDQRRLGPGLAPRPAPGAIAPWSWPSTAFTAQPAALKRASWSPVSAMVAAPVDGDVVVVPEHGQLGSASAGRRGEMASWLIPSIRQPSPAITQVRWSTRSSPKRAFRWRSAIAMPTAVARPWPSGPVVVSTPGVWPYSGWPGGHASPAGGSA